MESMIDRRTVVVRISENACKVGRERVDIDETTSIRYNWKDGDAPSYMRLLADHAKANGDRLLLAFGSTAKPENIRVGNTWFVLWSTADDWLMGRIHDAGDGYEPGKNDGDGYTFPDHLRVSNARLWVKLDQVTSGHGFPLDDYTFSTWRAGLGFTETKPLSEALKHSTGSTLFAMRKPLKGGD